MSSRLLHLGICLLVPGVLFCATPSASRRVAPATAEPACELLLFLTDSRHASTAPINGRLVVKNSGHESIVIVKPLLPTAWSVRFVPEQGSIDDAQTWEGSILRGAPDPGHELGYGASDYVTVAPGEAYEQALDVARFLRNQRSRIPLGVYELRVWYRYHPQQAVSRREAVTSPSDITSNVLRIEILAEAQ